MNEAEGTSPAVGSRMAAQTALTTLPLRHDWTGVITLSPLFSSYKYQGRETKTER